MAPDANNVLVWNGSSWSSQAQSAGVTWTTLSSGAGFQSFSTVGVSGGTPVTLQLDFGTGDAQVASGSHTHDEYQASADIASGWASITDGDNIAHGLGSAPSNVFITPSGNSYTFGHSYALSGTTGFYVYLTCAGSVDINWRAEL